MNIALGGEKGGTGKTTLAINLAAWRARQGREVLLIDADKQGSASKWLAIREANEQGPKITHVALYGETLASQVRALASRFDDVVIDTRGADSAELRGAMLVSSKLITPIKASQFDLFTMGEMGHLVEQARGFNEALQALVVINQAPTHAQSTDAQDAQEALSEVPQYRLMPDIIRNRKAFIRCAMEGRAVFELSPVDPKASAEFEAFAAGVWS